ncbi:MAG TPA: DUF5672 family protein [Casimicrobiaceae bacterium]|nr:DUF5672 family protein [Casimicrobiaceae bacterium]
MLDLPGVTLCCIDTANHALAVRALSRSAAGIRFARTLLLTDRAVDAPGIELRPIASLDSRDAYSRFVLHSLLDHVDTPHVLLVQWDGYAVNPAAWRDDFLDCDYIGARWFWAPEGQRVGNGGFSLRSRRLLEALRDPRIVLTEAEDVTIGRAFRGLLEREHAIRFASEALADAFAFEAAYPAGLPFGFHGLYNFCRVVPEDELAALAAGFSPEIARSPQLAQLGRNCLALAQWRAAAAIFQRMLDEDPEQQLARVGLARARTEAASAPAAGRNDPCPCGSGKRYKHCHGALTTASPMAPAAPALDLRLQQAIALHRAGDAAAAEAVYREVLAARPGDPLAEHFLGVTFYQRGELAAALPLLERSVAATPHEPEFHNNLGLALAAGDREPDAIAAFRAALALKPEHAAAWNNLGLALQAMNELDDAIAAFRRAIAVEPAFAHAHWNLALALLADGRYVEGWREYEWRMRIEGLGKGRHRYSGNVWDGAAAQGRTILLHTEQGLGDALQFARFIPRLATAGARVVVHCPAALAPLIGSVDGVALVISEPDPLPSYDAYLPLMSLPRVFGVALAELPAAVPYVHVEPTRLATARRLVEASRRRIKVGIAWSGNPAMAANRLRSCPLGALDPLFQVDDVGWFSLQQGAQADAFTPAARAARLEPLPDGWTLADTAALIAELDLVISVCTSIAHLSGALGRPTWTMLAFAADWRWLTGRADSPWYPTMRLFRQPQPRDWSAVANRVADALRAVVAVPAPAGR